MTCKEKLIADHPEWTEERIADCIKNACPSDYDIMDDPCDAAGNMTCHAISCKDCWNREIPGTDIKKENEEMKVCVSTCEEKTRLIEEIKTLRGDVDNLNQTNENLATKLAAERVLTVRKDEVIYDYRSKLKNLNQTNEDLANRLAAERVKVKTRTEDIEKLFKENEKLRAKLNENDDLINAIAEKNEEIMNLRAEKDAMAAGKAKALDEKDRIIESRIEAINKLRIEVDILRAEKETQAESIKDLLESNDKMKEDIKRKEKALDTQNDVINKLHDKVRNLEKRDEFKTVLPGMDVASLYPTGMYIEPDIEATYRIAEKLNACGVSYIVSADELCHAIARTMYNKYDALVKAGFSHDDAMSLIPMWTD